MAERIPQSVAIRVPLQGYLAADHFSPATGLTIAITISKNGGAYGNPSAGATNATGIANGSYYVDLSTTDTGTVGPLFVRGTSATMDPITAIYNVVTFVDQTGDAYARQGAPAGASISADIAAVKAVLPSALVSGRIDASVGAYQTGLTPLQPTTAGRTLDVSTGGEAGLDWANIGTPSANVTLSSTAVNAVTTVGSVQNSVGSVTGNVGGNVTGSVGSVVGAVGSVTGAVGSVTGAVGSVTAVVSANITKVNGTTVNGAGTSGSPWGP